MCKMFWKVMLIQMGVFKMGDYKAWDNAKLS